MNLAGKAIVHKTFGNGVIQEVSDNIVTVRFPKGNKKFLYPDAFAGFLSLQDKTAQKKIVDLLQEKRKEKEARRLAAQAEQERRQRLRNFKVTLNSQAAFGLLCNVKEEVFSSWSVFTGRYLSGPSKGKPRVPARLKPNSACLVTRCPKDAPEKERRILGAFMVREDFFGDQCTDGIVEGHDSHRLELKNQETLLFWDYFDQGDGLPRWGNAEIRYFSNQVMQRILFDMKERVDDEERRAAAESFYQYYCKINRLAVDKVGGK